MKLQRRMSRRALVGLGALGWAGGMLAACAPAPAPTATPAPKPAEKAAEKPAAAEPTKPAAPAAKAPAAGKAGVEVNLMAAKWVIDEWRLPDWIDAYNKMGPNKVNLEQVPDGWEAKVQAAIRSGDVAWDGVGIMTPFINKVQYVEGGMIQGADQYIGGSNVDGAKELLGDMVPTIKQDITYKGKVYGVPYSVEAIGLMFYRDPLAAVGYKEAPATWDDTLDASKKVGDRFKTEQITPIAWVGAIHTGIQGLTHAATKNPYDADGLLDVTGEAAQKALRWMQLLFKEGVTPPHGSDGYLELWQRAKLSMLLAQNSRGVWAQRVHGPEKADTAKLPLPAKGAASAGSPFWSNTFVVFEKAKQPQAYVDFLIWLLGPKNADVHKAIIESGKAPTLNSIYKSQVETNPVFKWMALHRDMIADSVPYPENAFWAIQNSKINPWITKLMEKDTTLTPEEAMANALKETKEEIAKQKVK
jgi:ABC-type glycerol-3-phosphate transport system substrate-binding protein